MMQTADLSQLQDIVETSEPSWWPPAPGWWVLAALVLVIITASVILLRRYIRRRRVKRLALRQLRQLDNDCRASDITLLLKQAALAYFPRQQIAALQGRRWIEFLVGGLPSSQQRTALIADIEGQLYSAQGDTSAYRGLAHDWLTKALPPKTSKPTPTEVS
ncbi:DUF4381 domain-containing protein [Idiomarina xiamenensis]|uniref:DUF4381 domain-containing protein n=1 Tax=Idiomarina xiamenensis 10-D-4 TaxID=740709 RepID=K2JK33_9GAMM|nr:DUF4381 domain-containing protein [Idiomarina xiamenensis]EKE83806.1 hypothetical protein A10D4_06656 [Idiomarina xiamenensis 10-D-4]